MRRWRARFGFFLGVASFGSGCLSVPLPAVHPAVPFANEACRASYTRVYAAPTLEVRVVFGYKDARPARFVADRYERMLFLERITGKCGKEKGACGFKRDGHGVDLFTKKMAGPDGGPREIRLRVAHSSVGPDDEENRKNPFQAWRTRYARELYLGGFGGADVVLYNGHSRAGGGPDFSPPRLRAGDEVDYGWYRGHTPGFQSVLRSMRTARNEPRKPRLVGFLSCASTKLFLGKVLELQPNLTTVTSSKLIYFADALEATLEALNSVLAMRCEADFAAAMEKATTQAGGARVVGWF